jgi:hypothetical protein
LIAFAVGVLGTGSALDRDRAYYPVVTIVVAHYYALFAVMGASTQVIIIESLVGAAFIAVAVWGFKSSLWIVAGALAAHGLFDLGHGKLISNPGVPSWWPPFCLGADIMLAVYLAWLLRTRRTQARA